MAEDRPGDPFDGRTHIDRVCYVRMTVPIVTVRVWTLVELRTSCFIFDLVRFGECFYTYHRYIYIYNIYLVFQGNNNILRRYVREKKWGTKLLPLAGEGFRRRRDPLRGRNDFRVRVCCQRRRRPYQNARDSYRPLRPNAGRGKICSNYRQINRHRAVHAVGHRPCCLWCSTSRSRTTVVLFSH